MEQRTRNAVLAVLTVALLGCGDDSSGGQDTDTTGDIGSSGATNPSDPSGPGSGASPSSASGSGGPSGGSTTQPGTSDEPGGDTDGADESGGESSGGPVEPPPGLPCEASFEHAGYSGCQTTVEGLEIKYFPLDEAVPADRLVVFLHGDTGADYIENWGFREEILDWALPQNYLVVGVRSPASYDGDTSPSFGAAQPVHADMVATTLEAVIDAYEITEERALYWGISGGSWFTTSSYIPVAGHRVPGIFVANCGGSGVSFGWEWDPATEPDIVALNSLYVNYGDQDFLAEPSAESYAEYTDMGFVTGQLVHPGATHCAHPISEPTLDFWMGEL
jgi:hypothetical protein